MLFSNIDKCLSNQYINKFLFNLNSSEFPPLHSQPSGYEYITKVKILKFDVSTKEY